ncbi:SDR family oxidoreductase [Algoriphagus aestuariicola]|jgi:NAD(P)-dependent dehydrogenase (short-subunit alcohol dehydrogenase family)|uniref:SDR family oxidoreductase n=1 Tax=Algoriphagus aestuariicola TaxID=1852016 RepID=A0ABS3BSB1_9BACT|nr:SDR family oxidoreductase [Algoriphagus aestuariicola]MBN7802195.1 SDR family oxidoreductase [Algoriphagus aestuariicola]
MKKKIALVTGGSRGLGKDMALRLSEKSFDVIFTFQNNQQLAESTLKEIEANGGKAKAIALDLCTLDSLEDFVSTLKEVLSSDFEGGGLDFLIHNAGMGGTIPFEQATEEQFDRFMNAHYKGVFFLTQKLLPLLNNDGGIITVSSGTTRFVNPGYSIYASMKGAIETLTKYLAKELGPRGIRANVVAPGPIETDFNNAAIRNNPQLKERLSSLSPLGRVGTAEDIGGVVAFLCSDDARWINAQRIEVSGGINT